MEAVSFTQQRPLAISKPTKPTINIAADAISSSDAMSSVASVSMGSNFGDNGAAPTAPFQSSDDTASKQENRPETANDPFYLTSSPAVLDLGDAATTNSNLPNSFGNIQINLGHEDEVEDTGAKKKKKKKEKKHKTSAQASQQNMNVMGQGFETMTVYESEDDDDGKEEEELDLGIAQTMQMKKLVRPGSVWADIPY